MPTYFPPTLQMELRNRTVGLRQQFQHSYNAEIPIQNSQSHNKCPLICNKSYSTYRLQHPIVSDVIHERISKHHNNLEAHRNPLLEPLVQSTNTCKHCNISRFDGYCIIKLFGYVSNGRFFYPTFLNYKSQDFHKVSYRVSFMGRSCVTYESEFCKQITLQKIQCF